MAPDRVEVDQSPTGRSAARRMRGGGRPPRVPRGPVLGRVTPERPAAAAPEGAGPGTGRTLRAGGLVPPGAGSDRDVRRAATLGVASSPPRRGEAHQGTSHWRAPRGSDWCGCARVGACVCLFSIRTLPHLFPRCAPTCENQCRRCRRVTRESPARASPLDADERRKVEKKTQPAPAPSRRPSMLVLKQSRTFRNSLSE